MGIHNKFKFFFWFLSICSLLFLPELLKAHKFWLQWMKPSSFMVNSTNFIFLIFSNFHLSCAHIESAWNFQSVLSRLNNLIYFLVARTRFPRVHRSAVGQKFPRSAPHCTRGWGSETKTTPGGVDRGGAPWKWMRKHTRGCLENRSRPGD